MELDNLTIPELKSELEKDPDNKEIQDALYSVLHMEVNIKDRGATSSEGME